MAASSTKQHPMSRLDEPEVRRRLIGPTHHLYSLEPNAVLGYDEDR